MFGIAKEVDHGGKFVVEVQLVHASDNPSVNFYFIINHKAHYFVLFKDLSHSKWFTQMLEVRDCFERHIPRYRAMLLSPDKL